MLNLRGRCHESSKSYTVVLLWTASIRGSLPKAILCTPARSKSDLCRTSTRPVQHSLSSISEWSHPPQRNFSPTPLTLEPPTLASITSAKPRTGTIFLTRRFLGNNAIGDCTKRIPISSDASSLPSSDPTSFCVGLDSGSDSGYSSNASGAVRSSDGGHEVLHGRHI